MLFPSLHLFSLALHYPTPTMKVAIKEWNAVATWHWNIPEDEVCGICRVQFDGTCPTCKFPGDDCALGEGHFLLPIPCWILIMMAIIVQGRCNHAFHMVRPRNEHFKLELDWSTLLKQHCLMTWIDLESSKGLCPMCRQSMLSLHCLCDIELTCLQNSNGRTRNNGIICGFFFPSHQWLSRRCRMNSRYPFVFLSGIQTWIGRVDGTSV